MKPSWYLVLAAYLPHLVGGRWCDKRSHQYTIVGVQEKTVRNQRWVIVTTLTFGPLSVRPLYHEYRIRERPGAVTRTKLPAPITAAVNHAYEAHIIAQLSLLPPDLRRYVLKAI